MLVLKAINGAYPDDRDLTLSYRLPTGLSPLPGIDNLPQAFFARSLQGGLMHLQLGLIWPELEINERQILFSAGRFRFQLKTPNSLNHGSWQPIAITRNILAVCNLLFNPTEAAIAHQLSNQGENLVDVEVELTFQGFTPTYPWLVNTETSTLKPLLASLLGSASVTWKAIETAFQELPSHAFTWHPLIPGTLPPPADEVSLLLAQQLGPLLFASDTQGWSLQEEVPPRLSTSLQIPRLQTQTMGLQWSWSNFLANQPDPSRHLIDIKVNAPFESTDLYLVNDLPLHPNGLMSLTVEIQTGGPTGQLHHEFRPNEPGAARLTFIRETFEELNLRWRAKAAVMTSQGPTVIQTDWRQTNPIIELTPTSVGLHPLKFTVDPVVFEYISKLNVQIGRRLITLTSDHSEAWAIGRSVPATVEISTLQADGTKGNLGAVPITSHGLNLGLAELGVGAVVPIILRPPADLNHRAAYLAVQIDQGPWHTVEPDTELTWSARQKTHVHPPEITYRTRYVPRSPSGQTQVMTAPLSHTSKGTIIELKI